MLGGSGEDPPVQQASRAEVEWRKDDISVHGDGLCFWAGD